MQIIALQKLVLKLLAAIAATTPYNSENEIPEITFIPQYELAAEVCGKPCPVLAMFHPDRGILMDARLNPLHDIKARSILLHELVHFVQWKRKNHMARNCKEWVRHEDEAYRVQNNWLGRQPFGFRYMQNHRRNVLCVEKKFQQTRLKRLQVEKDRKKLALISSASERQNAE